MKRFLPYLLSTVSSLALVGASAAADLPIKAPAAAPVPWSWSGFYIGANVGVASARSSISNGAGSTFAWLLAPTDADETGVIGGVQAGYNWQLASLVLGLEADISFASLNRSVTTLTFGGPDTYNARLSALSTVRGRIGYAFDRAMIYATGGVAFADLKDQLVDPISVPFTATANSSAIGWTVGGGIEYALVDHWTAKAEYLHVGFRDRTANDNAGSGYVFAFKDSIDIGRAGINYKF